MRDYRQIAFAIISGLLLVASVILAATNLDAPASFPFLAGSAGMPVFAGLTFALVYDWLSDGAASRYTQRRNAEIRTQWSEINRSAAMLTPEQLKAIPELRYEELFGLIFSPSGKVGAVLHTPGGSIPYEWVASFLDHSGVTWLQPRSAYQSRTKAREYAEWLTAYLVMMRFAIPHNETDVRRANGPNPAAWLDENSRDRFRRQFLVDQVLELTAWANERE